MPKHINYSIDQLLCAAPQSSCITEGREEDWIKYSIDNREKIKHGGKNILPKNCEKITSKPCVYALCTNNSWYVGSTIDVRRRIGEHRRSIAGPRNKKLQSQRLYQKLKRSLRYGQIYFFIIKTVETEQQARNVEKFVIKSFRPDLNTITYRSLVKGWENVDAGEENNHNDSSKSRRRWRPGKHHRVQQFNGLEDVPGYQQVLQSHFFFETNQYRVSYEEAYTNSNLKKPINIYARKNWFFLVKFMATRKGRIEEKRLEKECPDLRFPIYEVHKKAQQMRKDVLTHNEWTKFMRRFRIICNILGIPHSSQVLQWRYQSEKRILVKYVRDCWNRSGDEVKEFMKGKIKLQRVPLPSTYAVLTRLGISETQKSKNSTQNSNNESSTKTAEIPNAKTAQPDSYADVKKEAYPHAEDALPCHVEVLRNVRKQVKNLTGTIKRKMLPYRKRTAELKRLIDKEADEMKDNPADDHRYSLLQSHIFVPEDKGNKSGFWVTCAEHRKRIEREFDRSKCFEKTNLTESEAVKIINSSKLFPPSVAPVRTLPYGYVSYKGKCIGDGHRKCQRPEHACCRKICSYAHLPGKKSTKNHNSSVEKMLDTLNTAEIRDLSTAAREIQKDLDEIEEKYVSKTCVKCKEVTMGALVVAILDADNFFENVADDHIRDGLKYVADHQTALNPKMSKKSLAFIQKYVKTLKYVLVGGQHVYRQTRGTPIGGRVSKCVTSVCCISDENKNLKNEKRFKLRRFVDDAAAMTKMLCESCLAEEVQKVYKHKFDVERIAIAIKNKPISIRFLNMEILLREKSIVVPLIKNPVPLLSASHSHSVDRLAPIFWGRLNQIINHLRNPRMTKTDCFPYLCQELSCWKSFPRKTIEKVIRRHAVYSNAIMQIFRCLPDVTPTLARLKMPHGGKNWWENDRWNQPKKPYQQQQTYTNNNQNNDKNRGGNFENWFQDAAQTEMKLKFYRHVKESEQQEQTEQTERMITMFDRVTERRSSNNSNNSSTKPAAAETGGDAVTRRDLDDVKKELRQEQQMGMVELRKDVNRDMEKMVQPLRQEMKQNTSILQQIQKSLSGKAPKKKKKSKKSDENEGVDEFYIGTDVDQDKSAICISSSDNSPSSSSSSTDSSSSSDDDKKKKKKKKKSKKKKKAKRPKADPLDDLTSTQRAALAQYTSDINLQNKITGKQWDEIPDADWKVITKTARDRAKLTAKDFNMKYKLSATVMKKFLVKVLKLEEAKVLGQNQE
jgi:hypothetical protein